MNELYGYILITGRAGTSTTPERRGLSLATGGLAQTAGSWIELRQLMQEIALKAILARIN